MIDIESSNLSFLSSFYFEDQHLTETLRTFNDIKECVAVSSGESIGRVGGVMKENEKSLYDYPLFLLYMLKIIVKWFFKYENSSLLKYTFYIDMDIDNGTLTFENRFLDVINSQSGSNNIKEHFEVLLRNVNDDFSKLFRVSSEWFSQNCFYIKQQMFFNTYQMVKEGGDQTDNQIEASLSTYFGTSSDSFSYIVLNDINRKVDSSLLKRNYKDFIINNTIDSSPTIESSNFAENITVKQYSSIDALHSDVYSPPDVNLPLSNESSHTNTIDDPFSATQKADQQETPASEINEPSATIQLAIKTCTNSNYFSLESVSCIFDNILQTDDYSHIIQLRSSLERELEYHYNINCEVALSICEIILDSKSKLFRTRNIFKLLSPQELFQILSTVSPHITCFRKKRT